MKKLLLSFGLLFMGIMLHQAKTEAAAPCPECTFCSSNGSDCSKLTITAVPSNSLTCSTNAGSITVTVCNNSSSTFLFPLILTGPVNGSTGVLQVASGSCTSYTFTGLPNGQYRVVANAGSSDGARCDAGCSVFQNTICPINWTLLLCRCHCKKK